MGWLRRRLEFRQTTLLIVGCVAVLAGLALSRWVQLNAVGVMALFGFAVCLLWRKKGILLLFIAITLGLLIGIGRGNTFMRHVHTYDVLMKRPVVMEVTAASDAVYGTNSQVSFTANTLHVKDPVSIELPGLIKVEGFGVPMVYKGDRVLVEGKMFPTRGSNQARISYAQLAVIAKSTSFIDSLRRNFLAGLQSALPEPEASFGAGLLIGQRSTLPPATADQLSATGLTHLVAVSGYNLTIIIAATAVLLKKRSKYQTLVASIVIMLLFVLMTGLSASIVRAALVSSLGLLAWYYGRTFRPLLLLFLAAAGTALWNPFYLWSDIGWYLSFCAFFGVLVLAPLVEKRISPQKRPRMVTLVVIETLMAQMMTLPIIMYIFGRISIIGLLANVLVVPLVPLAMLCTLAAGIVGMLIPLLSGWVGIPAKLILTYMLDITALLSRFPHASVDRAITLSYMLALYGMIMLFSVILWRKTGQKYGKISPNQEVTQQA